MSTASVTLLAEVEAEYRRRTPLSAALYERAVESLPGGDTRNATFFRPYPVFIESGQGAWVTDADGNRLLDCINNYTSLILGHAHPAVVEALARQAAQGTAFGAANRLAPELAAMIKERVPSIDKLRFTNSGSEATMLAVRAARAFTGRPTIVKMRGAYHGSYDEFEIDDGHLMAGVMPTANAHMLEARFNDTDDLTRIMAEHGEEVAAVIVECVASSAGMIPPSDGFLQHVRAETERHGALMIVDEVITLRLTTGGAQALYGVRPDLTAMAKIIGGGLPVGAFGGREEVMQRFSPLAPDYVGHSGTFNGNPMTMAAGIATLSELDADTIGYINRLGDRFAAGVARLAAAEDAPLLTTGVGSLRQLHITHTPPRDIEESRRADKDVLRLLHLKLLTEGVLCAPRGLFAFSTVTTEAEVDGVVETLGRVVRWLRPAIED